DDDGQEDRSATPTSSPSASPPEAVSAIRAGVPDPPPPDADSAPVDSPGEASLVEPDPLSATPPRVVVFDRDACRREIRRTLGCSGLSGAATRARPAAPERVADQLVELRAAAVTEGRPRATLTAADSPPADRARPG